MLICAFHSFRSVWKSRLVLVPYNLVNVAINTIVFGQLVRQALLAGNPADPEVVRVTPVSPLMAMTFHLFYMSKVGHTVCV